jgi:hypothetical protein
VSRKQGNGEGSIHRRKDGGWCAQYTVYTAEGRKRKTIYGKTRAEVAANSPRRSPTAREASPPTLESSRWKCILTVGYLILRKDLCAKLPTDGTKS